MAIQLELIMEIQRIITFQNRSNLEKHHAHWCVIYFKDLKIPGSNLNTDLKFLKLEYIKTRKMHVHTLKKTLCKLYGVLKK